MTFIRQTAFEETRSGLRTLVLLLYVLVGPLFSAVLWVQGDRAHQPWPFLAVIGLTVAGSGWLLLRRAPTTFDWIFPVAVSPTLCCGIAIAECGASGFAYMGALSAPLAGAAVLFEAPVVVSAWVIATATCWGVLASRGAPYSVANAAVYGTIIGLVAWVVHGKASSLREARSALQASESRALAFLSAMPDAMARVDREGRFVDVHGPPGDALPMSREHLIGTRVFEFVPPAVAEQMREAVRRAFSTNEAQVIEYRIPYDSTLRSFEARIARAGPDEVVVIRRDTTASDRAQADQRFLATLVEHMQEAVITVDLDLRITYWSQGAEHMYGWKADEVMGRSVRELLQPWVTDGEAKAFGARLASTGTGRALARQQRKDGTCITIDSTVAAMKGAQGDVTGFLAVCRDVTAQRAAERALRESEERYRSVVAATGEGIVMRRADGVVSAFNPAAERLLGATASHIEGLTSFDPGWTFGEKMEHHSPPTKGRTRLRFAPAAPPPTWS